MTRAQLTNQYLTEETKNMTPEQRAERVNKIGEAAAKKYGFKRIASAREAGSRHN